MSFRVLLKWFMWYVPIVIIFYFALESDKFSKTKFIENFCLSNGEADCSIRGVLSVVFELSLRNFVAWVVSLFLGLFGLFTLINMASNSKDVDEE